MNNIKLDITKAACFLEAGAVKAFEPKVKAAQEALENGTCPGNDFLGWLHLPSEITPAFLDEIEACAKTLRDNCEAVVVAGIGGSYLGARAAIEFTHSAFYNAVPKNTRGADNKPAPEIYFCGNSISASYLGDLTDVVGDRDFSVTPIFFVNLLTLKIWFDIICLLLRTFTQ